MKLTVTQKDIVVQNERGTLWKVTTQTPDGQIDFYHTKEDLPMDKEIDLYECPGTATYPRLLSTTKPPDTALAKASQRQSLNVLALPSFKDLRAITDYSGAQNQLTALLNTDAAPEWFKTHPMVKVKNEQGQNVPMKYVPIGRVKWLLTMIFPEWWVEIKSVQQLANSAVVTVRLWVRDPVTMKKRFQDGVGAMVIQTDAGASASDWSKIKADGVMKAAPGAESYAIKDAADKFGRIFGRDQEIDYSGVLVHELTTEELQELLTEHGHKLTEDERERAKEIIKTEEKSSYQKLHKMLMREAEKK